MPRFRTLTQRFGSLYALVILLLIGVGVMVTLQLRTIRLDSNWLVGESTELGELASLVAELDAVEILLGDHGENLSETVDRVRSLLESAQSRLSLLSRNDVEDDGEQSEHDRAERVAAEAILHALLDAREAIRVNPNALGLNTAAEQIRASHEPALALLTQAQESVRRANRHVHTHARLARTTLIVSLLVAVILLGIALRQAERNVVHPILKLADGANRFGRGELEHRIQVDSHDELGILAASFNSMADQLSEARTDLEKRVQKRTQDFIRAARLADLGVLASGIAHELNTPLASIASSAEGMQRRANSKQLTPELMANYTQVITTETARAREITTRMLGLVRQDPGELARVPLALIAKQAVAALRHRAEGKQVSLASTAVDEGVHVFANAGELVQVIVNLLANAIDASPPGSVVDMSTWVDGSRLFLEVSDRGHGIPEAKLDSIFDPFYSTKKAGEGTGLGLALVATMVEFRGGTISVHSHLGSGTVFQVDLPADWSQPR